MRSIVKPEPVSWSSERAVRVVPKKGIGGAALRIRGGQFSQREVFYEVVRSVIPKITPIIRPPTIPIINDIRPTLLDSRGQQLVIVEATAARVSFNCLRILEQLAEDLAGLRRSLARVVPIVIIDMDYAHTRHPFLKIVDAPDGPRKLLGMAEKRGLIPVLVQSHTLRARLSEVLENIAQGQMPPRQNDIARANVGRDTTSL